MIFAWPWLRCLLDWGMMGNYYSGHMATLSSMRITPLSNQHNPNNCTFADSSINIHGPWESMCLKGTNGQLQSNVPNRPRFVALSVVRFFNHSSGKRTLCIVSPAHSYLSHTLCYMYSTNPWACIIRAFNLLALMSSSTFELLQLCLIPTNLHGKRTAVFTYRVQYFQFPALFMPK